MANTNYYEELQLDPTLSDQELDKSLKDIHRKWQMRINAPALDRRQEAERMVQLIEEAKPILLNPANRQQYNHTVLRSASEHAATTMTYEVLNEGAPHVNGEATSEDTEGLSLVDSLLDEAADYLDEELYYEAIKKVNQVIAIDRNNALAYYYLSDAYHNTDRTKQAITEVKRAIELDPYDSDFYFALSEYYDAHPDLNNAESLKLSFKWVREAIKRDPNNFTYIYHLAYLHRSDDDYDQALVHYCYLHDNWDADLEDELDFELHHVKYEVVRTYMQWGDSFAHHNCKTKEYFFTSKDSVDRAHECYTKAMNYVDNHAQQIELKKSLEFVQKSQKRVLLTKQFLKYAAFPALLITFREPIITLMASIAIGFSFVTNYIPQWEYNKRFKKSKNCRKC